MNTKPSDAFNWRELAYRLRERANAQRSVGTEYEMGVADAFRSAASSILVLLSDLKEPSGVDEETITEHARVLQDIPKPDDPGGRENGAGVSDSAARALYERWVDEQDIHCNRFKSWGEMTDKAKQEWRDKAVQANTGNPEIDRVIGRLMSSDPDFDDCENAAALIRRLAAKPQDVVRVPDGWRLVPIEPNWDMRNEGREFLIDGLEKEPEKLAYFLWKTMLDAAPEVK